MIFGYHVNNPLYREAHLMMHRIGEVLSTSTPRLIASNDINKIKQLLDGFDCVHFFSDIRSGRIAVPRIETIDDGDPTRREDLKDIIEDALIRKFPQIKDALMARINPIIQIYKTKIIQFENGRNILEGVQDSIRKDLIQSIVDNNEVLQGIQSKTTLSKLLFGKSSYLDYTFFSKKIEMDGTLSIHGRPEMYILFRMIYQTSILTTQKFKKITGISIGSDSLLSLKRNARNLINEFVFRNPYLGRHYIHEAPRRGVRVFPKEFYPNFLKPEYILIQSVWMAFYAHENNPELSFANIEDLLHIAPQFTSKLSSGDVQFSVNTLRTLISKFNEFIIAESSKDPLSQKLAIYRMALNDITDYARIREISFIKSKNPSWYDRQWFNDAVRGYHIATLLGRNLGFDILTFKTLDDTIFQVGLDENGNTYARHYFRDDPNRKASLYAEDLIITDLFTHTYYEYHLTEVDILVILDGFETMMSTKGSGPNEEITISDLEGIFGGNEWVLDKWQESPRFLDNLKEFNDRRSFYQNQGPEAFIQEYYEIAHARFFEHAEGDGVYSMLARFPGIADYCPYFGSFYFADVYEYL